MNYTDMSGTVSLSALSYILILSNIAWYSFSFDVQNEGWRFMFTFRWFIRRR